VRGINSLCYPAQRKAAAVDTGAQMPIAAVPALIEMNLRLCYVVSDIPGVTGLRIIRAIVAGERDLDFLASYRDLEAVLKTLASHQGHNPCDLRRLRAKTMPV